MEKLREFEKVTVIIPTIEGREQLLERLLDSLPRKCEKLIIPGPALLAQKRNMGAARAMRKYLLFIDDDNYIEEGAIRAMVESIGGYAGIVGMVAGYDDDKERIADGGSKRNYLTGFTKGLYTNELMEQLPEHGYYVDEVANAFMMRRQLWRKLGGFDEENFPIDLDEADFCKRTKNRGLGIRMCSKAKCYHKSQTYSHIPDFRRPLNAYFMGRNRVLYQRKHLNFVSYCVHLVIFCPVFVCFYAGSLIWRKKFSMIPHFLKGVFDGIFGRRKNRYVA